MTLCIEKYFFVFICLFDNNLYICIMNLQIPTSWQEKLEALEVGGNEPVDIRASAYTGIYAVYSKPGNVKKFSIRTVNGKQYAFRLADSDEPTTPLT